MNKLLRNTRLWIKGVLLIVSLPFLFTWMVLIQWPIEWAKDFEDERNNIK